MLITGTTLIKNGSSFPPLRLFRAPRLFGREEYIPVITLRTFHPWYGIDGKHNFLFLDQKRKIVRGFFYGVNWNRGKVILILTKQNWNCDLSIMVLIETGAKLYLFLQSRTQTVTWEILRPFKDPCSHMTWF